MDNGHKILTGLLGIAILIILLMDRCGSPNTPNETVTRIETVLHETVYDTSWYDTTIFKYIAVNVPIPYYDTTIIYESVYTQNDFDQLMKHPSIYEDTVIQDDTVHLAYRATVRGYLDKIEIGYKIIKPFLIESTTITETEVTKMKKNIGLYIGMDVAANKNGLTHLAPEIELVTPRMSFSGGYDLNDGAVVLGVKKRITFRRR